MVHIDPTLEMVAATTATRSAADDVGIPELDTASPHLVERLATSTVEPNRVAKAINL